MNDANSQLNLSYIIDVVLESPCSGLVGLQLCFLMWASVDGSQNFHARCEKNGHCSSFDMIFTGFNLLILVLSLHKLSSLSWVPCDLRPPTA